MQDTVFGGAGQNGQCLSSGECAEQGLLGVPHEPEGVQLYWLWVRVPVGRLEKSLLSLQI